MMATAVESPFSLLADSFSSRGSRHPDSIEIIDVDLLDDDDDDIQVIDTRHQSRPVAGPSGQAEGSRRNDREEIVLLDSDDEETPGLTRHIERRRLFSPPPRQNAPFAGPPPVPRLPPQYSGHASMVMRNRARAPPPPVQAFDRSFPFGSRRFTPVAGPSSQQPQASSSRHQEPAFRASPASHHVPTLGLGGALIASNRARIAHEQRNRRLPRDVADRTEGGFFGIPNAIRRIYPGATHPWSHLLMSDPPMFEDEEDMGFADFLRQRDRFRQPLTEKDHYKPVYTHPTPAEPGFTYDFAPETSSSDSTAFPPSSSSDPIVIVDEQEDSTSKEETTLNTLLVCARCQDPLVLNSDLTGDDSSLRRIWALRCGHLIDGKCLAEIGQPAVVVDRKGKGKAKEQIPYGEDALSSNTNEDTTDPVPSIRSRLRSRAHPSAPAPGAQFSTPGPLPPSPSRKRKRGPAKASPNKKAKVEEEYEWQCPVPSCGKVHASVKIAGVWGPEKERKVKGKKISSSRFDTLSEIDSAPRGVIPVFA